MSNPKKYNRRLLSTYIAAITLSAFGQSAIAADETDSKEVSEIVVTGSRIISSGFTQPTPTTTLTGEDLQKSAQPNVFTTIAQLPSLQGSTGTQAMTFSTSSGLQGLSSFSMRGLSPNRTLTLLDGQRVVPANVTGVTDISQFPQLLLERVDVVTGGASASYGSDAVGGVVNFITNKKFEGFRANLQAGESTYGDNTGFNGQVAWGTSFLDGKLHLQLSGEHGKENGVPIGGYGLDGPGGRDWYTGAEFANRQLNETNDGKPQRYLIDRAQNTTYARYGLITGVYGPDGKVTTNSPMKGIAFGESGNPYQFQYGKDCVANLCAGGDLSALNSGGKSLASELTRDVVYARVAYDLNDDNEIYFTVNQARVESYNEPIIGHSKTANLDIQCDNAFLPASIKQACIDNGITKFQLGTMNVQIPNFQGVHPLREQERYVIGANGEFDAFGTDWTYDTYYQYGKNVTDLKVNDIMLNPRYNAAIDAIQGPNGTIICRNPAARASGCVPMNIFGNFRPDDASYNYVFPEHGPHQNTPQQQNVASFNITGEPFSSWAGPVAVATGLEYRREAYSVTGDRYGDGVKAGPNTPEYPADPLLNTAIGNNWFAGNYHSAEGKYDVKEGYIEFNVPILDSDTFGDVNLNFADRQTKYSTAGNVNTWKVGSTWTTPWSGLRFRAVTSKDVRAPNLSELYPATIVTNITVNDGGVTKTVQQRAIGNEDLRVEVARNNEFGIVLTQPDWAPGFSASLDYFDIKVDGVISSLNAQQEVDLCKAGNQELCAAMVLTSTDPNIPNYVQVQAFNLAQMHNKGYDIEVSYRVGLGDGDLTLRALGTRTLSFITESGVLNTIPTDSAGVNVGSTPDWKVLVSETWDTEKWSISLTQRWISDGVYSNEFIECQTNCPVSTVTRTTVNYNHIDSYLVYDLGATYDLTDNLTMYAKVDNLFNEDPPVSPGTGAVANNALYDLIGRMYRVGVRMSF